MNSYKVWKPNASFKNLNENINYPIICWTPKCLRKKVVQPNPNPEPLPPQPLIKCFEIVDTKEISIRTFYETTLTRKTYQNYFNFFQLINKPIPSISGFITLVEVNNVNKEGVFLNSGTYIFNYEFNIKMIVNQFVGGYYSNHYYKIGCKFYDSVSDTIMEIFPFDGGYINNSEINLSFTKTLKVSQDGCLLIKKTE